MRHGPDEAQVPHVPGAQTRDPAPAGPARPALSGGEMAEALNTVDWARTSLGATQDWSQSLRTTVELCLASRSPMMVVWGPEHVPLYNDALAPLMGPKHPAALRAALRGELPGDLGRRDGTAGGAPSTSGRESSYLEDLPVFFHRQVPRRGDVLDLLLESAAGRGRRVAGALHPAFESTGRVLAERRMRLLRDLATAGGLAVTLDEACRRIVEVLAAHPRDVPFSALYLLDDVAGDGRARGRPARRGGWGRRRAGGVPDRGRPDGCAPTRPGR